MVIGSGLSVIACAKALLERGAEVAIVDIGIDLERKIKVHSPAPWQSTATNSVAPAAFAPRTAALISYVYNRRPS